MHIRENDLEHRQRWSGPAGVFRIIGLAIAGLVAAVVIAFLFGYLVVWLWNWLMPGLFGFKTITYWQAFGLVILAKIFFSGIHGGHHGGNHNRWHSSHWKKYNRNPGEGWAPAGEYSNWRYYEEYWNSEGKASFEAYLARIKDSEKK
jgi:hypothetical protein